MHFLVSVKKIVSVKKTLKGKKEMREMKKELTASKYILTGFIAQ